MDNIDWKWVGVSVLVFMVTSALLKIVFGIFGILTLGIGFILFFVLKPVTYFIGGYITGYLSPGITIKEPAIGAIIVVIIDTIFDVRRIGSGRFIWIILTGCVAYFIALAGAKLGEKKQAEKN